MTAPVADLPKRWRRMAAVRRDLSSVDPAADALEKAAAELERAIAEAADASKRLSSAEYALRHGVAQGTVRKWCAAGMLAGAVKGANGDWSIPVTSAVQRPSRREQAV